MRRFQYRFQRILELKESLEESRRASLGEALTAAQAVQQQIVQLEQTRQDNSHRAPIDTELLDVDQLRLTCQFGLRLEREIGTWQEEHRQASQVVTERRGELVEATRERRVYEILRERAEKAHRREQRRQERIWLDEIGQQLYLRRGIEQVDSANR